MEQAPRLGVGIIGAGGAAQTIHLPTLRRLAEKFRVVHIADMDAESAAEQAQRVGSRWSASAEELVADAEVDVVVVCTPPQLHAKHIALACAARAKVVLCEKPLAIGFDDIESVARIVTESETGLVVGAMHQHDPAWGFAREALGHEPHSMRTVSLRVDLPDNARIERVATEITRSRPVFVPTPVDTAAGEAEVARMMISNLLTHDLPLARWLADEGELRVLEAMARHPFHVRAIVEVGRTLLDVEGSFHERSDLTWRLDASSDSAALSIVWPPSFIHAGAGEVEFFSGGVKRGLPNVARAMGGYEAEWLLVHDLALGVRRQDDAAIIDLVRDAQFTEQLGVAVGEHILRGRPSRREGVFA